MAKSNSLIFTCEHGGNDVPPQYRHLFRGAEKVLASHRGWDPGALELAQQLAATFSAPLFSSQTSRLLVELNRSLGHPSLFSQYTRGLTESERQEILRQHYQPYRRQVEAAIREQIEAGRVVVHLSIHSFTPKLAGQVRQADIGLLYDPRRPLERDFCQQWRTSLHQRRADLQIRRNYPYRGISDGFTTWLRKQFDESHYAGIELEVNQKWFRRGGAAWRQVQHDIIESLLILAACRRVLQVGQPRNKNQDVR